MTSRQDTARIKEKKISNKQMMNRIQNESGPITHKYIIVSPDRSVKQTL